MHRRGGRFVGVDCVLVRTVERFARLVAKVQRVNRILGQVRAEADLCDNGPLKAIVAINAHRIGVH